LQDLADLPIQLSATRQARSLPMLFAALPTVGLLAAPSYASRILGLGLGQVAWDPMTARVLERRGWGSAVASETPITDAEFSHHLMECCADTEPRDLWSQLCVEVGSVGAVAGMFFANLEVRRIGRLAPPIRPFADAEFASAVLVARVNFVLTTGSLVGCLVCRRLAADSVNGRACRSEC
jgi:hypothetical protein